MRLKRTPYQIRKQHTAWAVVWSELPKRRNDLGFKIQAVQKSEGGSSEGGRGKKRTSVIAVE